MRSDDTEHVTPDLPPLQVVPEALPGSGGEREDEEKPHEPSSGHSGEKKEEAVPGEPAG